MGFLRDLGGKIWDKMKETNEEAQEYYQKALYMSDDKLMEELDYAQRRKNFAKTAGYRKAAKERGLI